MQCQVAWAESSGGGGGSETCLGSRLTWSLLQPGHPGTVSRVSACPWNRGWWDEAAVIWSPCQGLVSLSHRPQGRGGNWALLGAHGASNPLLRPPMPFSGARPPLHCQLPGLPQTLLLPENRSRPGLAGSADGRQGAQVPAPGYAAVGSCPAPIRASRTMAGLRRGVTLPWRSPAQVCLCPGTSVPLKPQAGLHGTGVGRWLPLPPVFVYGELCPPLSERLQVFSYLTYPSWGAYNPGEKAAPGAKS